MVWFLEGRTGTSVDPSAFIERFLPPHTTDPSADPFGTVEHLVGRITLAARQLSPVALPAFLWFSTRLFAGIRTSLNHIYDVSIRPVQRHFIKAYLLGKLRDLAMVGLTLLLFLANTAFSTGLAVFQDRGRHLAPNFAFLFSTVGRVIGELLAFGFLVSLFFALYHFASMRRPPWRAALVGSLFTAVLFEAAKRLFGLYIENVFSLERFSVDVNVAALSLFVVWVYYSALVFLLGGVVAETWELRELQRRQRS